MSLMTPTGNPWPFEPGHFFYSNPINLEWIERERIEGETDQQVIDRMKERMLRRE